MNQEYIIKNYTDKELTNTEMKKIVLECLKMAVRAEFPVDYEDMASHLFGEKEYVKLFVENEKNEIKGFLIGCTNQLNDITEAYIHGVILDPEVQGKSLCKALIRELIAVTKCDVLSARTHNPRIFDTVSSFAEESNLYFPNENYEIPEYIYNIVNNNKFINCCNEKLVCENAYPNVKVQQAYSNKNIMSIFANLGDYDAQVVMSIINKQKVLENNKTKKLK